MSFGSFAAGGKSLGTWGTSGAELLGGSVSGYVSREGVISGNMASRIASDILRST